MGTRQNDDLLSDATEEAAEIITEGNVEAEERCSIAVVFCNSSALLIMYRSLVCLHV